MRTGSVHRLLLLCTDVGSCSVPENSVIRLVRHQCAVFLLPHFKSRLKLQAETHQTEDKKVILYHRFDDDDDDGCLVIFTRCLCWNWCKLCVSVCRKSIYHHWLHPSHLHHEDPEFVLVWIHHVDFGPCSLWVFTAAGCIYIFFYFFEV